MLKFFSASINIKRPINKIMIMLTVSIYLQDYKVVSGQK